MDIANGVGYRVVMRASEGCEPPVNGYMDGTESACGGQRDAPVQPARSGARDQRRTKPSPKLTIASPPHFPNSKAFG